MFDLFIYPSVHKFVLLLLRFHRFCAFGNTNTDFELTISWVSIWIDLNRIDLSFLNLLNFHQKITMHRRWNELGKKRTIFTWLVFFISFCYCVTLVFAIFSIRIVTLNVFGINLIVSMQTISVYSWFTFEARVKIKNELAICVGCNCCCVFCDICACNWPAWYIWCWGRFIEMWSIHYNSQRNICHA